MTNHNSRIIAHTFPFTALAPAPHSNAINHAHAPLLALLFLAAAAAPPYAAAQMSLGSPSSSNSPYTNSDSSTAIVILVLVCFMFFICFFSIYILHCINDTATEANSANSVAARLRRFPRGLDPKVIESFPIFHYSEIKDHKIGKGTLECAVCINEFEDDETLRLLPKCNHVFHSDCIDAWLASHSTCPVCRANLVPEEVNQSNESIDEHNFRTELSEVMQNENQISISINVEDEEDDEENRDPEASEFPKQNREREVKFQRSHSTGHSLLGLGESCERYTLRLPEEVRKQIMMSGRLKRTRSCIVVLPMEGTSRGRFDRAGRLDRWIFSMTPLFLSKNNRSKAGSTET